MKVKVETDYLTAKVEEYIEELRQRAEARQADLLATRQKVVQEFIRIVPMVTEQLGSLINDEPENDWDDESESFNVSVGSSTSRNRPYTEIKITIDDARWFASDRTDFEGAVVRAERALELLKGTKQTTISIGPDDYLYKYLSKPEANVR